MPHDPIIDRSKAQKAARVALMRIELAGYGYSVVRSEWLQDAYKRVPEAHLANILIDGLSWSLRETSISRVPATNKTEDAEHERAG